MKIIKYALSILKDFIIGLLVSLLLLVFCTIIIIPLLWLFMLIPKFLGNLTNNVFVFIITFIAQFILVDLLLDGQSDIVDYFINRWKDIK